MRLRRGLTREYGDARRRNRRRGSVYVSGSRRDVKRLSQVSKKFDGHWTITASRKTCVIWNCVHHARKHLRGRRPPRVLRDVGANPKVCSRLLIVVLDDIKFSGELHRYTPARTYPSDSEARPVGSDERCREGYRGHLKSRSGARVHRRSHEQVQKAKGGRRKKDATSREPACNEPLEPARER